VRDTPDTPPADPKQFPDAGAYPDERDRRTDKARHIDCSHAHAARAAARSTPTPDAKPEDATSDSKH